ncbi:hypothetical protein LPJ68_003242 [Coemansia sp. RSA 1086]|nr:hypothetical protein LPJ68_003242 [Coemansia sp. RSA 1086]
MNYGGNYGGPVPNGSQYPQQGHPQAYPQDYQQGYQQDYQQPGYQQSGYQQQGYEYGQNNQTNYQDYNQEYKGQNWNQQSHAEYPHDKPSHYYDQQLHEQNAYGRSDEINSQIDGYNQYVGDDDEPGERGIKQMFTKTEVDQYGTERESISVKKTAGIALGGALAAGLAYKMHQSYKAKKEREQEEAMAQYQSSNTLYHDKQNPSTYNPYNENASNHPY